MDFHTFDHLNTGVLYYFDPSSIFRLCFESLNFSWIFLNEFHLESICHFSWSVVTEHVQNLKGNESLCHANLSLNQLLLMEAYLQNKQFYWNVTPLIRRGSIFSFFAAFYFSPLEFYALWVCLSCGLLPACTPDEGGRQWGQ